MVKLPPSLLRWLDTLGMCDDWHGEEDGECPF